jgi:MFS superfamily sulfate permease-like transporter|tara:strand:- start:449 stop:730 length:282 start_codon:yes stop_codon:yes gene_type:complete
MKKIMGSTEKRLFRERVIREYKLKHGRHLKNQILNNVLKKMKRLISINIAVGVLASIALGYFYGWDRIGYVFLFGVIWATLISTFISLFIKAE